MKQTAMQDLREDLILTQTSAKESLLEIENQEIRKACQEVVRLTLNNIIKRIDDELLEMEKQQKDDYAIELLEWLTNEKSKFAILYGNQKERFATIEEDYTSKQLLEIFKNK